MVRNGHHDPQITSRHLRRLRYPRVPLRSNGYSTTGFFTVASCKRVAAGFSLSGGTIYEAGFMQWAEGQKTWYVADGECGGIYNAF